MKSIGGRLSKLEKSSKQRVKAKEKTQERPYIEITGDESEAELFNLAKASPGKPFLIQFTDEWYRIQSAEMTAELEVMTYHGSAAWLNEAQAACDKALTRQRISDTLDEGQALCVIARSRIKAANKAKTGR